MPTRTVKPMSLTLMHKAYTVGGEHRFVAAAVGCFPLAPQVERFLDEHLALPKIYPALPAGEPLDTLYPKARGELLLVAQAHAPNGKPVKRMPVRVQAGAIDKTLKVSGDRIVKSTLGGLLGDAVDGPTEFVSLPLDWAHAYGGPDHPCNKAGIGYTGKRAIPALPNVEADGKPIRRGNQKTPPAGFGPRNVQCPDRQKLMGSFDKRWLREHAPHLPRDFSPAAFNVAPADQQLKGWWTGGESYRLEGLHPQQAVFEGVLPDFRVRLLVLREGETAQQASEMVPALDTIWLLPDLGLGVAVYRAEMPCADIDADDVTALLAAYEHRADPPRPLAHYRDALDQRIDPAVRHLHVLDDSPLTPEVDPAAIAARRQRLADAGAAKLAAQQALLDEMDAEFWAQHPDLEKPADYQAPVAKPSPLGHVTPEAVMNGDVQLSQVMLDAKRLIHQAESQGKRKLAELDRLQKTGDLAALIALTPMEPADKAEARLELAKLKAAERAALHPRSPLDEVIKVAALSGQFDNDKLAELRKADRALTDVQRTARRLAGVAGKPVSAAVSTYLGELVRLWVRHGEPLAGRDLSGADLSGMDLSGQDLSGTNLSGANLTRTSLRGARMVKTVLNDARLTDADLSRADLSEANLNRILADGIRLRGASLRAATGVDAVLTAADLRAVSGERTILTSPDLRGAQLDDAEFNNATLMQMQAPDSSWSAARLTNTIAYGAKLAGASLRGARLTKVVLVGAEAPGSTWSGARLEKSLLNLAKFGGADFRAIRAIHNSWRDSDMHDTDWRDASLFRCDLGEARLLAADLRRASFAHSLLMKAKLNGANAQGTDFFQAMLRKADLRKADLRAANLVRAMDEMADYRDAKMADAVRTRMGEAA